MYHPNRLLRCDYRSIADQAVLDSLSGTTYGAPRNELAMQLIGIDLAWRSDTNPTALAVGLLADGELILTDVAKDLFGINAIVTYLSKLPNVAGIAIDGPLLITNSTGQRKCESLVGQKYGSRHASCHTSNKSLFPNAHSVQLSHILKLQGFQHLGAESGK